MGKSQIRNNNTVASNITGRKRTPRVERNILSTGYLGSETDKRYIATRKTYSVHRLLEKEINKTYKRYTFSRIKSSFLRQQTTNFI